MKTFLILVSFIFPVYSFAQSKKDLMEELRKMQEKIETLQKIVEVNKAQLDEKINALDKEITILRTTNATNSTLGKTQESNINGAADGSINTNSANNLNKPSQDKQLKQGDGLTPKTGATIYTGPRGGQYYINKNGNKTYIKRKN